MASQVDRKGKQYNAGWHGIGVYFLKNLTMQYGQKRHPKDVKTQPQEEFINETNDRPEEAADETPVIPGTATPVASETHELGEEVQPTDPRADKKADKKNRIIQDDLNEEG